MRVSVSCYRKMIADHEKNYRNGHERIVLGAQLGLRTEPGIEFLPC